MIQDFLFLSLSFFNGRIPGMCSSDRDRHKHIDYHSRPSSTETLAAERRRK